MKRGKDFKSIWEKELRFWEGYAKVYHHIEAAGSYSQLIATVQELVEPKAGEIWLDAGCGPAKMSQLIWEKSGKTIKKIVGIDIVLDPARETLSKLGRGIPLELKQANLGEKLPFPDSSFDGIVSNLALTYVIDFEGRKEKEAFIGVMKEMYRVLKAGGHIVWSTPKKNPFFGKNFLAALPNMLSIRTQLERRVFGLWVGLKILKYGLGITSKGKKGIYTFLEPEEYEKILRKVGFENFEWKKTFAGQAWVNRAYKKSS